MIRTGRRAAPAGRLKVSTHAVFRWMERAGLVDIEQLRESLTAALDRAYQASAVLEAQEFLILQGGLVYVVRDGTVVTVITEDGRHRRSLGHTELTESVQAQGGRSPA